MAKAEANMQTSEHHTSGNGNGNHDVAGPPKGWRTVETSRPTFSADRGKAGPIQGYLVDRKTFPGGTGGKPWDAFIVRLTAPCMSVKDRDGQMGTAEVGREVIVPVTRQLEEAVGHFATHPTHMAEVWIKPDGQIKTAAGSMNNYEIQVNPDPVRRTGADRMLVAHNTATPAGLLTAGSGSAGQGHDADGDIPF